MKILLRDLLTKVLYGAGYNVLAAKDGLEAFKLAAAHQNEIDMLITNVQMPGMTGQELARDLTRVLPNLPVLLVSGQTESVVKPYHSWSFLQKPYFPSTLLARPGPKILSDAGKSRTTPEKAMGFGGVVFPG